MTWRTEWLVWAVLLWVATPVPAQEGMPDTLAIVSTEPAAIFGLPVGKVLHFTEITSSRPFREMHEIVLQLSDDSPEDLEGGGALFMQEMVITTTSGLKLSNRRVLSTAEGGETPILDFLPIVEGGFRREGYIAADGREIVAIQYRFGGPEYMAAFGPPVGDIARIDFYLLLANDYRIGVFVDEVYEAVMRSPGNVKDGSNQAIVHIAIADKPQGSGTSVAPASWAQVKYGDH